MNRHLKIIVLWILCGIFIACGLYIGYFEEYSLGKSIELFVYFGFWMGGVVAIVHSLGILIFGKTKKPLDTLPLFLLVATLLGARYFDEIANITCNISQVESLRLAKELIALEGYDMNGLDDSGIKIEGCSYVFEYTDGKEWRMIVVDRYGKAQVN